MKRPKYLGKSADNIPTHMNLLWNGIYFILLKCIPPPIYGHFSLYMDTFLDPFLPPKFYSIFLYPILVSLNFYLKLYDLKSSFQNVSLITINKVSL